jgi:hypothetical protein
MYLNYFYLVLFFSNSPYNTAILLHFFRQVLLLHLNIHYIDLFLIKHRLKYHIHRQIPKDFFYYNNNATIFLKYQLNIKYHILVQIFADYFIFIIICFIIYFYFLIIFGYSYYNNNYINKYGIEINIL